MRSGSLWRTATQRLELAGIPDAGLEAEVLIRHALKIDRSGFFAGLADSISPYQADAIGRLLERRAGDESRRKHQLHFGTSTARAGRPP